MIKFIIKHGAIIILNIITVFNFILMTLSSKYNTYLTFLFILFIDLLYVIFNLKFNKTKKGE